MNPYLLRQLWSLVEGSQSGLLLGLDDTSLVHWLLEQLSGQQPLNSAETDTVRCYIRARLPLIRQVAQS